MGSGAITVEQTLFGQINDIINSCDLSQSEPLFFRPDIIESRFRLPKNSQRMQRRLDSRAHVGEILQSLRGVEDAVDVLCQLAVVHLVFGDERVRQQLHGSHMVHENR